MSERLHETPKTAALAEEIKRNNWQDWHNLEKTEEHAKTLERSENKLKHRIQQLLKHRGHVAAESVMDKMAAEISSENSILDHGTPSATRENAIVEIRSKSASVAFTYDLPSLSAPQKVRFRKRLAGMESGWDQASRQDSASYDGLPPGTYRFEVMASNAAGQWSTPSSVGFVIIVPFWQRMPVMVAAILAVVAAAVAVSRWFFTRRMRQRLREIQRRKALDDERSRIASDLHDDIGAGLTCITYLSQPPNSGRNPGTPELEQIRDLATDLTKTLDQIVWAVSPKHDNLESLANYITARAHTMLDAAGIRCRLGIPVSLPEWQLSADERHNLFLAFSEALHNVVKHSRAREARIALRADADTLEVEVSDDGCGLGPIPSEGEGLGNMRERMERLGGRCVIRPREGGGTTVTLHLAPAALRSP